MLIKEYYKMNLPENIKNERDGLIHLLDNGLELEKVKQRIQKKSKMKPIQNFDFKEMNMDDDFYKNHRILFADINNGLEVDVITDHVITGIEWQKIEIILERDFGTSKVNETYFVFGFEYDYIVGQLRKQGFVRDFETEELLKNEDERDYESSKILPTEYSDIYEDIMERGLRYECSDIHVEPKKDKLLVRYRVHGELGYPLEIPLGIGESDNVLNIFVNHAKLSMSETREGQNGRLSEREFDGRKYSFRLSTQPVLIDDDSTFKIVIRVMEKGGTVTDIEDLGFSKGAIKKLRRVAEEPNGLVLVTGPTGSGKSTSLHSLLSLLDSETMNIHTIEDPVERLLDGVNQTCVQETGRDYGIHLKNLLRQDPDVMLVGEIRDQLTAKLSVQGALTGHLVFSTLHTNGAYASIQRMRNFEIDGDDLSASLRAVIGQRLVKTLCPSCKRKEPLKDDERAYIQAVIDQFDHSGELDIADFEEVYHAQGCYMCGDRGYVGRTVVAEVLEVNDDLKVKIQKGESLLGLGEDIQEGWVSKEVEGVLKCKPDVGLLDIQEVKRVCGSLGVDEE